MHPPISPADLATLISEAAVAARRLHRKMVLPAADLDDLRQDLLVDLICRLPGFDARRGSIGAFANIVLRNQSSRIAMRIHRQRRAQGGTVLSLDAPIAGGTEPLGCMLTEADGLAAWHGQNRCAAEDAELRHDLEPPRVYRRVICSTTRRPYRLCSGLHRTPPLLQRVGRSR